MKPQVLYSTAKFMYKIEVPKVEKRDLVDLYSTIDSVHTAGEIG